MDLYKLVSLVLIFWGSSEVLALGPQGSERRLSCRNPRSDFACMACNCYNEAGNQSYAGQVAVGKVVQSRVYLNVKDRSSGQNRSPRYASTPCAVIKQHKQFSWWHLHRRPVPARHSCFRAAADSLRFQGFFADHYHADYVSPRWRRAMVKQGVIGDHIFYVYAKDVRALPFRERQTPHQPREEFNWWSNTFAMNFLD